MNDIELGDPRRMRGLPGRGKRQGRSAQ